MMLFLIAHKIIFKQTTHKRQIYSWDRIDKKLKAFD